MTGAGLRRLGTGLRFSGLRLRIRVTGRWCDQLRRGHTLAPLTRVTGAVGSDAGMTVSLRL